MKKLLAAVMAALMLCTLYACGAKETTPFKMKLVKGNDGYTCYGFKKQNELEEVEIPGTYNGKAVQYVDSFVESDIVRLTIGEGVEGIASYAFRGCSKLETVRLPQSLTRIDTAAFSGCTALKELYIPANIDELEMWAFAGCSSLETVVITGQVDTLGREVFKNCSSLKVLYLPGTLTAIHPDALDGCDALEEIHFAGTLEEFLSINFYWDWMSAKNVLVCCADNDILMEDTNSWEYSDQWVLYPRDPMEALSGDYVRTDVSISGEAEDRSDPAPDETLPGNDDSEPKEFINTSRSTQATAPYQALAMEHDGWIYFFDDDGDLCRADTDMNNIALFCAAPLGTNWNQDDDSVNIIGISDTDVLHLTGLGHSYVVDLASGQMLELLTDRNGESVRLYGMNGEWIYYTRSYSDKTTLYRSGLSDGFAGEEAIVSGDLQDIYVTDTCLIYVLGKGYNWSMYCAPIGDLQMSVCLVDSDTYSDYYAIGLVGADSATVVYSKGGAYVTYKKYYACDLSGGAISGGAKFPVSNYAYDADTQRIYFFSQHLVHASVSDLSEFAAYYNANGYENPEITLGWRITCAGDWMFFRRDFRGGGANCCIDKSGSTFIDLRGLT